MITWQDIFQISLYHGYIPQILIAEVIFSLKLRRRDHFWVRLAIALPISLFLMLVIPNIIAFYVSGLFSLIIFLLTLPLMAILFENKFVDILFCCVSAQFVQNLSFNIERLICSPFGDSLPNIWWYAISLSCSVITYLSAYFILVRKRLKDGEDIKISGKYVIPFSVVTALFIYIMQYLLTVYNIDGLWVVRPMMILCCVFGLVILYSLLAYTDEQAENERLESYLKQTKEEYKNTQKTIELINMKAHDLKHYVQKVRDINDNDELIEIESVIEKYEKTLNCGNKTLNYLLTQKLYICDKNNIEFEVTIEGDELAFMRSSHLISLFSNLVDNAIECEMKVENIDRRYITVKAFKKKGMIFIHAENYCEEFPERKDGELLTSKENTKIHGFGIKSMKYVVSKYKGSFEITEINNSFNVDILIPLPNENS